ncbi:SDR family oxidoreductase [Maribacter sp. 2307ULW6-5]|uniref:SDR family oxidoreductase n=1 Tax=Maribacter sp. 2307ULW6-5 TaxID=3386275 RepID=UPI0039BC2592
MKSGINLENKVALVSGGAKNLGLAITEELAAHGASVLVHYHSNKTESKAGDVVHSLSRTYPNAKFKAVQADLTQVRKIELLMNTITEDFGRLDVLVNNAGALIKKPMAAITEVEYDQLFSINTKSPFFMMQKAAERLEENGRIINIGTSLLAAFTGLYSAYAGSKAPLEDFGRALAQEIGSRGITVNTIAPGPLETEFLTEVENEATLDWLRQATVGKRLGQTTDIAPLVAFLASEKGQWITGQTLFVNGGFATR